MSSSRVLRVLADPEWRNLWQTTRRRGPLALASTMSIVAFNVIRWAIARASGGNWPPGLAGQSPEASAADLPVSIGATDSHDIWRPEDLEAVRDYAHAHLATEVQRLIDHADRIVAGTIPVFGTHVGMASGRLIEPVEDSEVVLALNRWYHGVVLAKAFAYTGNQGYASAFRDTWAEWRSANPRDEGAIAWESYSVSERIVNWLFAGHLFRAAGTASPAGFEEALAEHADYLLGHLETRHVHNHLINNGRALFEYGLLCPALPRAADCRERGLGILTRELRQFDRDAVLAEQSTHYHLLLMRTYGEVAVIARAAGCRLPADFTASVARMFDAARWFVRPDCTVVAVGDVSPDADPQTLGGMLSVGSAYFEVPTDTPPSEAAVWWLGAAGLRRWSSRSGPHGVRQFPDAGWVVVRQPDVHLVVRGGPRSAVERHGHVDMLGVDLWTSRGPVLIDPGNSSFAGDAFCEFFRSDAAHSTVVVDGLAPYIRSATLRGVLPSDYVAAAAAVEAREQEDGDVVITARHSGYRRLPDPVDVERRVTLSARLPRRVQIVDRVAARSPHSVDLLFQIGRNEVCGDQSNGTLRTPDGATLATFSFRCEAPFRSSVIEAREEPRPSGWISPAYGERHAGRIITCRVDASGPFVFETTFDLVPTLH